MSSERSSRYLSFTRQCARPLIAALAIITLLLIPGTVAAVDLSLSDATKERLKKHLPRCYPKLIAREPVHVVALGDSITNLFALDDYHEDWVRSYPAIFLDKLANEFMYTGGVRLIRTKTKKHATKLLPLAGPEITYNNLASNGATVQRGLLRTASRAFLNQPDLVLINFGLNDSNGSVPLDRYEEVLALLIDMVRAKGADCIVLGCTFRTADPNSVYSATSLPDFIGLSRPYAALARDLAEKRGVFFADLGDPRFFVKPLEETDALDDFILKVGAQLEQKAFLFENGEADRLHIGRSAHRRLGSAIHQQLVDHDTTHSSLTLNDAILTLAPDGGMVAEASLTNSSDQPISCQVAPLAFTLSHRPVSPAIACTILPGEFRALRFSYAATEEDLAHLFPAKAGTLYLPLLVSSPEATTTLTTQAKPRPIGVTWDTGMTVNIDKTIEIKPTLSNPSDKPFSGEFTATWNGQESRGSVSIPSEGKQQITIKFTPPASSQVERIGSNLVLTFSDGPRFVRKLELIRNLGLQEWRTLEQGSAYQFEGSNRIESPPSQATVRLKVDADQEKLYLTYDLGSLALSDAEDQLTAVIQIQLDGRAYGKRQAPGPVGEMVITFSSSSDGMGTVNLLGDCIFGVDYTADLSNKGISALASTRPDGKRRIMVSIPRKYFYCHEYGRVPEQAIGNGNSQFGINTFISLLDPDPKAAIRFPNNLQFLLVRPLVTKYDAETLGALELSNPRTGRWAMHLF